MKIKTKSGSLYLQRGVHLTRISEVPVGRYDVPIVNKVIKSTYPISPTIGEPMTYFFDDGYRLNTTVVVSIEQEMSFL